MTRRHSPFRLPPRWRWTTWPFIAISGGGTAVGLWLLEDPLAVAGEACLPLASLPALYALVCWFCRCVFKATSPCRKDLDNSDSKRS
jgi:hypothetical protein